MAYAMRAVFSKAGRALLLIAVATNVLFDLAQEVAWVADALAVIRERIGGVRLSPRQRWRWNWPHWEAL